MNIQEMHYDLKSKLNKIDSNQYINLLVPQIDWKLNEAIYIFIDYIIHPENKSYINFEKNQRHIDSIRTLVVRPKSSPNSNIIVNNNIAELPGDYLHYIDGKTLIEKEPCPEVYADLKMRPHFYDSEREYFEESSYEWRQINGVFFDKGIEFLVPEDLKVKKLLLTYIRKPAFVHNAQSYKGGKYKLPSGEMLTGSVDCDLPEHVHSKIVDIAVYLIANDIQGSNIQAKMTKIGFNSIK